MKRINNISKKDSDKIEQFTELYHIEFGKGHVVSVTHRRDNNLIMGYFPNGRCHEFVTERELRSGVGDITLTRQVPKAQEDRVHDSLQSALENLFAPR